MEFTPPARCTSRPVRTGPVANHPSNLLAFGMLTAFVHGDQEGYMAITDQFGGCGEALGALGRLGQMLVKMLAENWEVSTEEALRLIGVAIAAEE